MNETKFLLLGAYIQLAATQVQWCIYITYSSIPFNFRSSHTLLFGHLMLSVMWDDRYRSCINLKTFRHLISDYISLVYDSPLISHIFITALGIINFYIQIYLISWEKLTTIYNHVMTTTSGHRNFPIAPKSSLLPLLHLISSILPSPATDLIIFPLVSSFSYTVKPLVSGTFHLVQCF